MSKVFSKKLNGIPIKIGIDASNIRHGGGRTHLIELLTAADPIRDRFSLIYIWGSEETLRLLPNREWLIKCPVVLLGSGFLLRMLWQVFSLGRVASKSGCSILFVPGGSFSTSFRPVVTMHQNLLPFTFEEILRYGFSLLTLKWIVLRFTQSRSFRLANGVIFLSNHASSLVHCVAKLPKSIRTRIIGHGLSRRFLDLDATLHNSREIKPNSSVTLLYVSTVDQYKHQWNIVEGVALARERSNFNLKLRLVGSSYGPSMRKLMKAIKKFDPEGCWVSYLGESDYSLIHKHYNDADIGIWASTCETFGLILVEMLAAGLPILSSNREPMPEILGDAACYFDPLQPELFSENLLSLLESDERRSILVEKALERAKLFSWESSATETFKFLYNQAINK